MKSAVFVLSAVALFGVASGRITTTTYEIKDPVCGETDIPTKYVKLAEKFDSNLKTGTCASQGYTVPDGNTTKKTPIGNLIVHEYKKPSSVQPLLLS